MNFSEAVRAAEEGAKVRRSPGEHWSADWTMELVQFPPVGGREVPPMLMCDYHDGKLVLFAGGQGDIRATDWEIAE